MSTNIIPFAPNPLAVANRAAIQALNAAALGGISTGFNRLSIKGGWFRFIVDGAEISVLSTPIQVVIVSVNQAVTKTYYSKPWNPNDEDQRPDCASSNGVTPDSSIENPVHNRCGTCPMNKWGSKISPSGVKVKACNDSKRVALVAASDIEGSAYQLVIPGTSLNMKSVKESFGACINTIAANGYAYNQVVIEISFDPSVEYPRLLFKPVGVLRPEEYEIIYRRMSDADIQQMVSGESGLSNVSATVISATPIDPTPVFTPAPAPAPVSSPVPAPQVVSVQTRPTPQRPKPVAPVPPPAPEPIAAAAATEGGSDIQEILNQALGEWDD